MFFFVWGEVGFESLCKFAPREHDTPPAAFAFESYVRTEARDGPFVGAAWMLLAQAQVVVKTEVGEHGLPRLRKSLRLLKSYCNHYKMNRDKLRARNYKKLSC
jgi:hypothetical protein